MDFEARPWIDDADVAVIGAGFGGLGAAITLAEAGVKVVLLEALKYPGGCASTFRRDGYAFEAGATLFSGFGEGQLMRGWIDRHGLDVEVDWLDPVIELRTPSLRLPVHRDREAFVEQLCALPDAPVDGLRRFFRRQEKVADTLWALFEDPALLPPFDVRSLLHHARRSPRYLPLLPLIGKPLGDLLAGDGLDDFEPLRIYLDALCQITVQTSASEAESTFALAATDYAFRGTAHVRGGIGALAWALTSAVRRLGGHVHMASRVKNIRHDGDRWHVSTRRGTVRAPVVVANLIPQMIASLTDAPENPKLARLADRLEDGWGAAMWYLGIEDRGLDHAGAHHLELIANPHTPFIEGNHVFCSLSDRAETGRAPAGQRTVTTSTHVPMKELLALDDADRGRYIAEIQERMMQTIAQLAPEISTAVVHALPASPRTFARFTGRPGGYVGGVPRRAGLHNYRSMAPTPLMHDLYMVGDTAFPGQSTLATAIGGAKTAACVIRELQRRPALAG